MGNRVERVQTNVSELEMAQAIISAWQQLFGTPPAKEQVALVLAQNALETGHRKSMYNFNIGNITTSSKGPYNYYDTLTTSEQTSPGVWEKKNLKYRAYNNLQEGVVDYLKFLSNPSGRYSEAWQHILHPNPVSYSQALKKAGYYTANEAPYTKYLTSLFEKFNKSTVFNKPKQPSTPTGVEPDMEPDMGSNTGSDMEPDIFENDLNPVLDQYLDKAASANKGNYKKYLQNNIINIKVRSSDVVDSIEFSNILCQAIDEELLGESFIHTNGNNVEVECNIAGPTNTCLAAVNELTQIVANKFKLATRKIGSININTNISLNKKSLYKPISLKVAELNHRKFLLKFI